MTIELPTFDQAEVESRRVEPETQRNAEELTGASELLDPLDTMRFLRTIVAALQAEERTLARFIDPTRSTRGVM